MKHRMGEGSEPVPQQFDIGRGEMRRGRLDGAAKDGFVSPAFRLQPRNS
jgi:hypothetical protein